MRYFTSDLSQQGFFQHYKKNRLMNRIFRSRVYFTHTPTKSFSSAPLLSKRTHDVQQDSCSVHGHRGGHSFHRVAATGGAAITSFRSTSAMQLIAASPQYSSSAVYPSYICLPHRSDLRDFGKCDGDVSPLFAPRYG